MRQASCVFIVTRIVYAYQKRDNYKFFTCVNTKIRSSNVRLISYEILGYVGYFTGSDSGSLFISHTALALMKTFVCVTGSWLTVSCIFLPLNGCF